MQSLVITSFLLAVCLIGHAIQASDPNNIFDTANTAERRVLSEQLRVLELAGQRENQMHQSTTQSNSSAVAAAVAVINQLRRTGELAPGATVRVTIRSGINQRLRQQESSQGLTGL